MEHRALLTVASPAHHAVSLMAASLRPQAEIAATTPTSMPTVLSVGSIRSRNGISGLIVSYSGGTELEDAGNRDHYSVFTVARNGTEKVQRIRKVIYEPESGVAAVFFARKAPLKQDFNLTIQGLLPSGTVSELVVHRQVSPKLPR